MKTHTYETVLKILIVVIMNLELFLSHLYFFSMATGLYTFLSFLFSF